MAFTVESMEPIRSSPSNPLEQNQFDLPVKEFMGYDPKGSMRVTGQPIVRKDENAPQSNTTETPVEVPPGESLSLSPRISAVARKEAAQRQREQAFRQRERSLEAKLASAEKYEALKAKIANKDYTAADELGMTYEEYTNYLLNKQAGEKPEEQRFRKVEEKLSQFERAQEEKVSRDYQANQGLWKQEISKVVKGNEAYPEINFAGPEAEAAILQHINDSFDEDDVELSAEQAASEIEKFLSDRALKLADSPTIQKRFEAQKTLGPPRSSPKTITQQMTTTSQKPNVKPFHLMSETEQLLEAIRRVNADKMR